MKWKTPTTLIALLVLTTVPAAVWSTARIRESALAEEAAEPESSEDRVDHVEEAEGDLYSEGADAIDEGEWAKAIDSFDRVLAMKHNRADGALYWKAYAQSHAGRGAEALETIAQLEHAYPKSRWMHDARALAMDIQQAAGQKVAPETVVDDELRLIAIQGLLTGDPERALPLLEKLIQGNYSRKVKEQALFVLSQSPAPRAAVLLAEVARGHEHAELQDGAIKYLGVMGGSRNLRLLDELYRSAASAEVKEEILHALMVGGARQTLFALAKTEKNARLRAEAIRQLGVMGSARELQELYASDGSTEVKKTILQSMFVGGSADVLAEIARTEPDLTLRATAVRTLGLIDAERTGKVLVSMYQTDAAPEIKRAALEGLFVQGSATALVDLARREKDRSWRKEIVSRLALMDAKEAHDYLNSLLQ